MIKVTNIKVNNFEGAIRGMRNPLESWGKSDSSFGMDTLDNIPYHITNIAMLYANGNEKDIAFHEEWLVNNGLYIREDNNDIVEFNLLGPNDVELMQKLIFAGTDHSKFMRQIQVSMDIEAPLYWWKEFDTYKVGTVANSCSTMHKLSTTPITEKCFSWDGYSDLELIDPTGDPNVFLRMVISDCEQLRQLYNETGDKRYWRALIQLLPESWMQKRTVTFSYQNARNMYFVRKEHKLSEWHEFCSIIEDLPYANELITIE